MASVAGAARALVRRLVPRRLAAAAVLAPAAAPAAAELGGGWHRSSSSGACAPAAAAALAAAAAVAIAASPQGPRRRGPAARCDAVAAEAPVGRAAAAAAAGSRFEGAIGLEMQAPWAALLLWGYKTVETRLYPLPDELLGREVFIIESAEGAACVSGVADDVQAGAPGLRVLGTAVFSGSPAYPDRMSWEADEHRHRVPPTSPYGWKEGRTIYGWEVSCVRPLAHPVPVPEMHRIVRSVFSLDLSTDGSTPPFTTLKSRLGAPPQDVSAGSIPTVDITPFMQGGSAEEQQRVVDAIRSQCEYIGFLRVTWDRFPFETVAAAQDAARRFFACSEEEKLRWSKNHVKKSTSSYTSTGYRASGSNENNKNRESWSCTLPDYSKLKALQSGDPAYFLGEEGQKHFALSPDPQVPWPDEGKIPGFHPSICDYYSEVECLGQALLRIFARVLGCEEDTLLKMADKHVSPINLFSFTMGEGGEVLPAHADVSTFTIISHDTSARSTGSACLEILTPDGVWEPVHAQPGCFLVNVGQILQRWSNGRLRATVHRVVPPAEGEIGTKRQSITFFQLLNYNASVSVLEECRAGGGGAKYPPENVAEWTADRISGFYLPSEQRDINKCWFNYNKDAYVI